MKEKIIYILKNIQYEKDMFSPKTHPNHAMFLEIKEYLKDFTQEQRDEFNKVFKEMLKSGEIISGNTLNSKWYRLTNAK